MKSSPIVIHTPFIRLDAFLKFAGGAESGGHAKLLIQEGQIQVDGEVCLQRGRKLTPGMTVRVGEETFEVVGCAG